MRKLFCIMLSVGWCAAAMGQPADVSRVLRTIDFEERRLGNDEDLPMHWLKLEGDGLPPYVNGKLASDRAHSGTWSFRFTLDGGSLIYRYDPDQLPVQYQAHYRMTAWVSTTPMAHARARITAYFTDRDMHAIPGSITHSDVYAAENDQVAWKQLQLEMTATDSQATYLAIELELVQPRFYQTSALGNRALFPQDIDGTAWFDDVTVSQVPEVKLETDKPGNIFRFNDDMRMTVTVNDRFTQDLASQLVIKDGTGAVVYKRSGALEPPAKTNLAPGVRRTIIALPDLHPGWYEANLVMTSQGQLVGEQHLDFVRLADNALGSFPDGRFGIIATHMPIESWGQLPGILPVLSAGRVKLAVWNSQWDVQEDSEQSTRFDGIIQALEAVGITPTACLVDLPPSVTRPPDAAPVDDVSQGLASSTWIDGRPASLAAAPGVSDVASRGSSGPLATGRRRDQCVCGRSTHAAGVRQGLRAICQADRQAGFGDAVAGLVRRERPDAAERGVVGAAVDIAVGIAFVHTGHQFPAGERQATQPFAEPGAAGSRSLRPGGAGARSGAACDVRIGGGRGSDRSAHADDRAPTGPDMDR
jgi:hypothetical protein